MSSYEHRPVNSGGIAIAGHTPGPWRDEVAPFGPYEHCYGGPAIYSADNTLLAEVLAGPIDRGAANARLIAAAPELLEALERLLSELAWVNEQLDLMPDEYAEAQTRAARVLAKARGVS